MLKSSTGNSRLIKIIKKKNLCLSGNPKGIDINWPKSFAKLYYSKKVEEIFHKNKSPRILEINNKNYLRKKMWIYYFDDPSLYDDYTDNVEEEYQSETLNETDYTLSGTSAADNLSASSSSNAYTLAGYAGNDILAGGLGDDVLWGGLGKDSLTGGDGADQFYYTNLLQGPDVITDFGQNGDADTLLFAHSPTSSYTRTSAVEMFSTVQAFDYSTNGNVLPYVFAFEDPNLYGVEDAIPLSNILTNLGFRIWGHQNSNTTLPDEDYFLLIPGASDVGINVFVWTDGEAPNGTSTGTGDGIVDYTELSFVASLAGGDTSNITGDEFAFQSISGFSV